MQYRCRSWPQLRSVLGLLFNDIAVVAKRTLIAENLHFHIPQGIRRVQERSDKVRLSVRNVQKHTVILEHAVYLFHVSACIVLDLVRWAPGAAVDHGIEGALVESNLDRLVGEIFHIA